MKISELIAELEKMKEAHGDLECYGFCGMDKVGALAGVTYIHTVHKKDMTEYKTSVCFIEMAPAVVPEIKRGDGDA